MATPRMDITSFVGKLLEEDDVDLLREGVRVFAQAVMETEVSGQIGAAPYERSSERTAYRNGYRTRRWDTRTGTIELKIPKLTAGTYFPCLLEPRRRAEKALHAVIVEAYVKGISTRKVDDLVRALGIEGISRSEVSRICKVLDEEVKTFLHRPIEGEHPYVWLDATFHKVRQQGRHARGTSAWASALGLFRRWREAERWEEPTMSRVLVIDDEPLIGTILSYAFGAGGHEMLVADSGRGGIELARAEHPDVIVLDLMMPAVNGYDVLEVLRDDDATKKVPILVLTAVALARERERCLSEGADVVMTKPFDPRDVARAVEGLLAAEAMQPVQKR